MKCMVCTLKYIGQTGRTFNIRYKEHIQAIRNNNNNSGYSNHILNTGHTCGTINDTMGIIRKGKKGKHLNALEKFYIHKISKSNLHMNDTYNDTLLTGFEAPIYAVSFFLLYAWPYNNSVQNLSFRSNVVSAETI
jgi:hypothetical protein